MTLRLEKKGFCIICGKRITDWAHIFGRNKDIVNEVKNLLELCKKCHADENQEDIMQKIRVIQNEKYNNWDEWALETARTQRKHNWMELLTR